MSRSTTDMACRTQATAALSRVDDGTCGKADLGPMRGDIASVSVAALARPLCCLPTLARAMSTRARLPILDPAHNRSTPSARNHTEMPFTHPSTPNHVSRSGSGQILRGGNYCHALPGYPTAEPGGFARPRAGRSKQCRSKMLLQLTRRSVARSPRRPACFGAVLNGERTAPCGARGA